MATCKDRELVVSEPFGESLIFLPKIPLGRLFSKIIFKIFRDFFYFWNVQKIKTAVKVQFLIDQMSKIRCEDKVSSQS